MRADSVDCADTLMPQAFDTAAAQKKPSAYPALSAVLRTTQDAPRGTVHAHAPDVTYPAQQESCFTSFAKVCAASLNPSTIVRYGKSWFERSLTVMRWWMASAAA